MNNEISNKQRIALWKQVLSDIESEKRGMIITSGICFYLKRELRKLNILDASEVIWIKDCFPELLPYKPLHKLDYQLWWERKNHDFRIKVIKEIINQLEEEQLLYPIKTE